MTTTADSTKREKPRFRVVGTRPIRHDGVDKVTGRAKFGIDTHVAGLLCGAILRSPHAHARIRKIDASKAEALPGVKAVMTAGDLPEKPGQHENFWEVLANVDALSRNMMARDKVLFKGHAVAAVAAINPHVAEEALGLIEIEYETLPHVIDVHAAMEPGAPILHDDLRTQGGAQDATADAPTNVANHIQFALGDVAKGFKEADAIVERSFQTKSVHQGYIEPSNSTASWSADGYLTIWKSTQAPFIVRQQVALILRIPVSSIRIVPMEIGGGFGGKVNTDIDPIAAILSKKTGRPVKIVLNRSEVFEGTGPAPCAHNTVKIGATKDGKITAVEATLVYGAGAFPGGGAGGGAMTALSPYKIENVKIDGYDVVVNTPWTAAYRAPGVPQAAHATEQVIDELAQKLEMDPMELRLKNVTRPGDRQVTGIPFPSMGIAEVEEAMLRHPHYRAPLGGPNRGRGAAMGYWGNHGMHSSATIAVNSNGTISLITGSVDIGGSRPVLAIQAAEVLGIDVEDIRPSVGDTDSVGYTSVTGGSRTAHDTGIAVIQASEEVIRRMRDRAALLWETQAEDVAFQDGVFVSKTDSGDRLTFKELAAKLLVTGGPVSASASVEPKSIGPSASGMIVDVEVDPETGKVDVLRATIFQDAGKAAHPSYVEGQMQGGATQGLGWGLNEEYFFDESGAMANSSFLDYRMPITMDLPMIEPVVIEVPSPGHPFGLRGVGESSIVSPMAAVSNAISRATGVRMEHLPLTPRYILERTAQAGENAG